MPCITRSVKDIWTIDLPAVGLEDLARPVYDRLMDTSPQQLRLVIYPDPVLRTAAKPIDQITDSVRQVAQRMLQIMHDAPGVGLAAPQVGISWRLFVANHTQNPNDDQVFINPVITPITRESVDEEEGCLSLPHITAKIRRPKTVSINALDLDGSQIQLQSDDLAARVWQHETDHLDGILILDRMSKLDRLANRSALRELERGDQR